MAIRNNLRVFVASSSEQNRVAHRIAEMLRTVPGLQVDLWNQGVFKFSATYIESLEAELDKADFAVLVLTGDDRATVRRRDVKLPRDNLIFELGLFMGRMGRDRCIFFIDRNSHTRVASDLEGVECAYFHATPNGSSRTGPRLSAQLQKATKQLMDLGPRYKPSPGARDSQRTLWNFSSEVAGFWWERMRSGDDNTSALSYVSMSVDEVTNAPTMEAWAYDLDGKNPADWKSLSTGVLLGSRPRVYYRWQGEHEDKTGQIHGGGGHVDFDASLGSGHGQFYGTNFARLTKAGNATLVKRFRMARATAVEIEIMRHPWSAEATALIRGKLKQMKWSR